MHERVLHRKILLICLCNNNNKPRDYHITKECLTSQRMKFMAIVNIVKCHLLDIYPERAAQSANDITIANTLLSLYSIFQFFLAV